MKILFLDLDGVLNIKYKLAQDGEPSFDAQCVKYLNAVCEYVDYKIVVTSTWRMRHSVASLQTLLKRRGVEAEILDTIEVPRIDPDTMFATSVRSRPDDIRLWLSRNPEVMAYAVLDDVASTTKEFGLRGIHVASHTGVVRMTMLRLVDCLTFMLTP